MFDEAALSIEEMLVQTSASGLTYIAEWKYGKLEHKEQTQPELYRYLISIHQSTMR